MDFYDNKKKLFSIGDAFEKEANNELLQTIISNGYEVLRYFESSSLEIKSKAFNLFQILIIVFSAIITFIINSENLRLLTYCSIIGFITLYYLYSLYKVYFVSNDFAAIGIAPIHSLDKDVLISSDSTINHREVLRLTMQEIQRSIDLNKETHEKLEAKFSKTVKSLLVAVLFSIILLVTIQIIYPFLQESLLFCQLLDLHAYLQ